jgi:hypothetical protein
MQRETRASIFRGIGVFVTGLTLLASTACKPNNPITQAELVRRTQELFDSVAGGDPAPWKKYYAEDCMYFDEKGNNMDKAALVASITPLPPGYSGTIKIANPKSHIEEDVAILSYDMDETEAIFGQNLTARYHATDTWMRRQGQWQIVAGQVLRYYEDPAAGRVDPTKFNEYVGTYELAPGNQLTILVVGKELHRQRGDKPKEELIPEEAGIFYRKGVEGRILFRRDDQAKVDALIDRRNNEDVIWKRVSITSQMH